MIEFGEYTRKAHAEAFAEALAEPKHFLGQINQASAELSAIAIQNRREYLSRQLDTGLVAIRMPLRRIVEIALLDIARVCGTLKQPCTGDMRQMLDDLENAR